MGFWWPSKRSLYDLSISTAYAGRMSHILTCTLSLSRAEEVAKEKASMLSA
jgi:hypothetical protein